MFSLFYSLRVKRKLRSKDENQYFLFKEGLVVLMTKSEKFTEVLTIHALFIFGYGHQICYQLSTLKQLLIFEQTSGQPNGNFYRYFFIQGHLFLVYNVNYFEIMTCGQPVVLTLYFVHLIFQEKLIVCYSLVQLAHFPFNNILLPVKDTGHYW